METLTTLDRAIRLQKVDLFSELETDLLALLGSIAKQIPYARGEVLFNEQAPATALYVVLAGRIQMSRGGQAMVTVGPDDTIGNWALFDEQPSVVTASAEEDSWLLRIEQQDFFDLLADHSEITPKMFQALFKRVRSLLWAGLGSKSGDQREGGDS